MPEPEDAGNDLPAWGMGDLAPTGANAPRGGAPVRVGFRVPVWDAIAVITVLVVWTGLFVFLFAQR